MNAAVREIAPVEVYGAKDVRQFEIDDNPSIYHLMSEIVYTKLPLAIVREYLTNGWDSHKEAGTTHLFLEVHFSENPARILIKDRGTGLDFDGMNRVFRYYFRTTKDDNPEATGRLGIGSKVAFTCTTMFTAIGVKDGRRHVFAIHLGEKRRPHVATMTPVPDGLPTDEPNGVTIDIPLTDNSDIKVFQTYVQDLQRASAMKIRMFVSGKEIPAPDALFGPALAEHGFAYCTQPLVGDWGKAMPCVIQGEIPYSAEPISPSNHPISLRGLYLHAPSRAYEHNLSREALRVTDRARDTLRAQLAPIEAQIEGAYLALLTQTIERAPLSLFLCLADPDFRRDYFDKIAAGRKVFAGAAEAALYLAANGLDGALYAKVEQRFAERRFGRRFKSRADAQATIRRALAKAVGAVAATLGGDAAKTPLLRYMRAPKAPPPISPRSKAYMLLDPAPKRTDRQTYTRSDPAADPQADRTLALRQNRLAAAEAMLRAATAGAPALVIRPASVKTLHASWGDHPSPFTFYVLPTDPKSPAPPESHVPPGLAHQLRRLAGRAGIVVDTMPQLAEPRERPAAAPRLPAETPSAPKTVQPRLMRSVDFDHEIARPRSLSHLRVGRFARRSRAALLLRSHARQDDRGLLSPAARTRPLRLPHGARPPRAAPRRDRGDLSPAQCLPGARLTPALCAGPRKVTAPRRRRGLAPPRLDNRPLSGREHIFFRPLDLDEGPQGDLSRRFRRSLGQVARDCHHRARRPDCGSELHARHATCRPRSRRRLVDLRRAPPAARARPLSVRTRVARSPSPARARLRRRNACPSH